jgi:AcrR family transcriptional regulator
MPRPRAFDEAQVTSAAAALFAGRPYDAVSVDDLVAHLGVHRNSLYKIFGSKSGLYRAALVWHLRHRIRPLLSRIAESPGDAPADPDLDLLLLAAVDRAPHDAEVGKLVTRVLGDFDSLLGTDGTARLLGARIRDRIPS